MFYREKVIATAGDSIPAEIEYYNEKGEVIGFWAYGYFHPDYPYQGGNIMNDENMNKLADTLLEITKEEIYKSNQKIVDICFSIALTINSRQDYFKGKNSQEVAEWVSSQLDACGFPNHPCRASWGKLNLKGNDDD